MAEPVAISNPFRRLVSFHFEGGYTVVAGHLPFFGQDIYGFIGAVGSIAPTEYEGITIRSMISNVTTGRTAFSLFGTHPQGLFTSLTFNGSTFLAASANFTQGGGITQWDWPGTAITGTGTYQASFEAP